MPQVLTLPPDIPPELEAQGPLHAPALHRTAAAPAEAGASSPEPLGWCPLGTEGWHPAGAAQHRPKQPGVPLQGAVAPSPGDGTGRGGFAAPTESGDAPLPCSAAMSAGSIEQEPSRKLACCGVPLITEDMQSLAIRTLSGTDISKHYDLIRELGKGTYGKVDLVSHKSTGEGSGGWVWAWGTWPRWEQGVQHVPTVPRAHLHPLPTAGTKMALKFVNKSKTKLKNFLREFSITNTLSSSPFIIKVFDVVFETEDCYVFAQEYAPGGDLFDIIPPQVGAPAPPVGAFLGRWPSGRVPHARGPGIPVWVSPNHKHLQASLGPITCPLGGQRATIHP